MTGIIISIFSINTPFSILVATRLTKETEAYKLLEDKLRSGQLSGWELPDDVRRMEEEFNRFELTRFQTCYYRMRDRIK